CSPHGIPFRLSLGVRQLGVGSGSSPFQGKPRASEGACKLWLSYDVLRVEFSDATLEFFDGYLLHPVPLSRRRLNLTQVGGRECNRVPNIAGNYCLADALK